MTNLHFTGPINVGDRFVSIHGTPFTVVVRGFVSDSVEGRTHVTVEDERERPHCLEMIGFCNSFVPET